MKTKINNIGVFLTSFILLISVFSVGSFYKGEDEGEIIVLVNTKDPGDMKGLDVEILEYYEDHILIRIKENDLEKLDYMEVNTLPEKTMIYIGGDKFDFTQGEPDIPDNLRIEDYEPDTKGQYIVHMIGPIARNWRPTLEDMGVEVLNYVPNHAYRVRMTPEVSHRVENMYFVDWVGIYHPAYKLQPGLQLGVVDIGMVPGSHPDNINRVMGKVPVISSSGRYDGGFSLTALALSKEVLYSIANIEDVEFISEYIEPEQHAEIDSQIIGGGAWIMDDDNDPSTPYRGYGIAGAYINQLGYTGKEVTVAIADSGLGDGTTPSAGHPDFKNRVQGGYSFGTGVFSGWEDGRGHGTHCAGSLTGNTYVGTLQRYAGHGPYYVAQGLAYGSEIYAVRIFNASGGWIGPDDYYEIVEIAHRIRTHMFTQTHGGPVLQENMVLEIEITTQLLEMPIEILQEIDPW